MRLHVGEGCRLITAPGLLGGGFSFPFGRSSRTRAGPRLVLPRRRGDRGRRARGLPGVKMVPGGGRAAL